MSNGISGFGTTLSGASTGVIGEITSISVGDITVNVIDISTMASASACREFIAGMKDAGEITFDLVYEASNHDSLQDALIAAAVEVWTVTFPDTSTFVASGFISSLGIESPMDDVITQAATIKISGLPAFTAAS